MKIAWTKLSLTDLNHAYDFISFESPGAANHVIERIEKATHVLIQHPDIGRPGRVTGTRELIISSTPFIIVYRVREKTIQIISLIHSSRKWPESFQPS